jgi:Fe2+ transport system protein A
VTDSTTLDLLPPRRPAQIVAVDWNALAEDEAKRLHALGIEEGAQVAVAHRGIFTGRDPVAIEIGRMTVAIRRSHARAMTVAPR